MPIRCCWPQVAVWTADEVCKWLSAIGLHNHASTFSDTDIGGALLCTLTLEDLCEDMHVPHLDAIAILRHRDHLIARKAGVGLEACH